MHRPASASRGPLATLATDQELRCALAREWDRPQPSFAKRDQHTLWFAPGLLHGQEQLLWGQWEVAFPESWEACLPRAPPVSRPRLKGTTSSAPSSGASTFPPSATRPARLPCGERYEESSFLCKSRTCADIKDNVVGGGFYFTAKEKTRA